MQGISSSVVGAKDIDTGLSKMPHHFGVAHGASYPKDIHTFVSDYAWPVSLVDIDTFVAKNELEHFWTALDYSAKKGAFYILTANGVLCLKVEIYLISATHINELLIVQRFDGV